MLISEASQRSGDAGLSQLEQLLNFCDEFTELNDYCAFFCQSVSLIASHNDLIDKQTSQGLRRYAQSLRDRAQCLQSWLQQIQSMSEQK